MVVNFNKLQGTGNDFILIDQLVDEFELSTAQIRLLCDRHYGVGSDGLLILRPAEGVDFVLKFYNPDGSQSFCGNGSRCAAKYFMVAKRVASCEFSAFDGVHKAELGKNSEVALEMKITESAKENSHGVYINTGAPHVCIETKGLNTFDLEPKARLIRWSKEYKPVGVNVNYFEKAAPSLVNMRTFEKGVEGETLSCGTGVTAVAIAVFKQNPEMTTISIKTRGGRLEVSKDAKAENTYWLKGSVVNIFTGKIVV